MPCNKRTDNLRWPLVATAAACCGFVAGVWLGPQLWPPLSIVPPAAALASPAAQDATQSALSPPAASQLTLPAQPAQPAFSSARQRDSWDAALAVDLDAAPEVSAWVRLRDRARTDQSLRLELMQRFAQERDLAKRARLRALLAELHAPDVAAFGLRLLREGDASVRRDAITLLQGGNTREIDSVLIGILRQEPDANLLCAAIGALPPEPASPPETAEVLAQLQKLVQHPNPEVRAASLQALPRWDVAGVTETSFLLALNDADATVRELALASLVETPIRSPALKDRLLAIWHNPGEEVPIRQAARSALQHFPLGSDELLALNRPSKAAPNRPR